MYCNICGSPDIDKKGENRYYCKNCDSVLEVKIRFNSSDNCYEDDDYDLEYGVD